MLLVQMPALRLDILEDCGFPLCHQAHTVIVSQTGSQLLSSKSAPA